MLYDNTCGSISQNTAKSIYTLAFKGKEYSMHFCEFLNICKKLTTINIEECLLGTNVKDDSHKLVLFRSNTVLTLTLTELIGIADLFEGAMFSLKVRDLVYRSNTSVTSSAPAELVFA